MLSGIVVNNVIDAKWITDSLVIKFAPANQYHLITCGRVGEKQMTIMIRILVS